MRSFLWAVGLLLLPSAMAGAQLLDNAEKPARDPAAANRDAKPGTANRGVREAGPPRSNAMFDAIDANADGVITKLELRKAIKALQTLDADEDGSITLAEANVGGGPAGPGAADDPQVTALMANDANGDGKLQSNEVPNNLMPMLQGADQNRDQAIDRQELAAAMAAMRNRFGGGPVGAPWNGRGPIPGGARNAADPDRITGQFLQSDRNGDGRLTADELPAQSARLIRDADQNGDNALDVGELQAALAKMGDRARAAGFEVGGDRRETRFREPADRVRNRDRGTN
jgi:Ca2+-binding EF-hand superfamily protein